MARLIDINVTLDHPLYPNDSTADAIVRMLDSDGVDGAVVTNLRPLADLEFDRANEQTAKLVRKLPRRLTGFGIINPLKSEHVDNAISNLGLKGIRLSPNFMWIEYSERVECVVERAVKLGATIHVSVTPERPSNMKTCAEIAERFQDAKVIIGQIWTPYTWNETIVLARHYDNIYLEVGFTMTKIVEDAVESVGASKLLFGSGMPLMRPRAAANIVNSAAISDEDKDLILFKNASRVVSFQTGT